MSHPVIGQPAPRFELPIHRPGHDGSAGGATWSLGEHVGGGTAVVLIFHRHIH